MIGEAQCRRTKAGKLKSLATCAAEMPSVANAPGETFVGCSATAQAARAHKISDSLVPYTVECAPLASCAPNLRNVQTRCSLVPQLQPDIVTTPDIAESCRYALDRAAASLQV